MLGIEPVTTTSGTVHNGITDDGTRIDNLYPTFVLTRVNQLEVTGVAGRVLPLDDTQFVVLTLLHPGSFKSHCRAPSSHSDFNHRFLQEKAG